jgi:outer membrane protein assembly factor BamB
MTWRRAPLVGVTLLSVACGGILNRSTDVGGDAGAVDASLDVVSDVLSDGGFPPAESGGPQSGAPWPMFRASPGLAGLSLVPITRTGHVRWTFQTAATIGCPMRGSPLVDREGTVYAAGGNVVYALDANGAEKWHFDAKECTVLGAVADDDVIYFVSTTVAGPSADHVWAFGLDGVERWVFKPPFAFSLFLPPTLAPDGTLYVPSSSQTGAALYALGPSGNLLWTYGPMDGGENVFGSSVAVSPDGTIFAVTVGAQDVSVGLSALRPDGSRQWRAPLMSGVSINAPPAAAGDSHVFIASNSAGLYTFSAKGMLEWQFDPNPNENHRASPAIGVYGTTYLGAEYSSACPLRAIDTNGKELWSLTLPNTCYSQPPVVDPTDVVVIGDDNEVVRAVADGGTLWNVQLGGGTSVDRNPSTPAVGGDGTVYIGSGDGKLYAIGP